MQPIKYLPLPKLGPVSGCFWRPNEAFVAELTNFLAGKRVLEIFAGNGYLAGLLNDRAIQVQATSQFSGHDWHDKGLYHPVTEMAAQQAVAAFGSTSDVLLVSWPTVTDAVVHAARIWGHEKDIVFIGEMTDYTKKHLGGCATDAFFEEIQVTRRFETYQGNQMEHAVVCRLK